MGNFHNTRSVGEPRKRWEDIVQGIPDSRSTRLEETDWEQKWWRWLVREVFAQKRIVGSLGLKLWTKRCVGFYEHSDKHLDFTTEEMVLTSCDIAKI